MLVQKSKVKGKGLINIYLFLVGSFNLLKGVMFLSEHAGIIMAGFFVKPR